MLIDTCHKYAVYERHSDRQRFDKDHLWNLAVRFHLCGFNSGAHIFLSFHTFKKSSQPYFVWQHFKLSSPLIVDGCKYRNNERLSTIVLIQIDVRTQLRKWTRYNSEVKWFHPFSLYNAYWSQFKPSCPPPPLLTSGYFIPSDCGVDSD